MTPIALPLSGCLIWQVACFMSTFVRSNIVGYGWGFFFSIFMWMFQVPANGV